MSTKVSESDISQNLLDFVIDGKFPDSDIVVSAEFSAKTTPRALDLISTAKEEIENEISTLSREIAPDIDNWISQAKQLHADIERSRVTAREIVVQHEKGLQLRRRVAEAAENVERLQNEIRFTQTVSEIVREARALQAQIASGHQAQQNGQHHESFERLREIEATLKTTRLPANSHVFRILSSKFSDLRQSIRSALRRQWDEFAKIDLNTGQVTIASNSSVNSTRIEKLLDDLEHLELFDIVVDTFQQNFLSAILYPILESDGKNGRLLSVEGDKLYLQPHVSSLEVPDVLNAVLTAFNFLRERLPSRVIQRLAPKLFPAISSNLITERIYKAIPVDITRLNELDSLVTHITRFAENLREQGWQGVEDVSSWNQQIPKLWLKKRRAQSLDEVRCAIISCTGTTTTVERVEKEQLSDKDGIFVEKATEEDWNAGWTSDNENRECTERPGTQNDDEDVSAWGLDDEVDVTDTGPKDEATVDDDIDEAWGWGDENEDSNSAQAVESAKDGESQERTASPSQREVTLKEFYKVTDIPSAVLSIVSRQISDGELLVKLENASTSIAASGPALLALPTLIIAMFKATAPLFYPQKFKGGQMLLYNDSMYLAEQLQVLFDQHNLSKLRSDVETIEKFGRMAYGREMQTQQTILTDLLDGCQGFANCAEQPFLAECENSVAATIDRLRDVHREWSPILSRSALLQSIGSLLSTVIGKIIIDIEDLSDISDAESQKLAGFCNSVSKLEDLFLPEGSPEGGDAAKPVPMTAMYVPNWLKFQYLINMLEGSLADIKYLWNEGELKLEFSAEEVVDLIKALFADSEHRRRAIAEIRRNAHT
ncbi:hypothetical protein VTO42DRAFT_3869 [Malbranchea cinnamomea]